MTDETPRKGEHRERQGLLGRARDRFERMEPKRQALLLAVAAVIALAATIALNPFQSTTSDQPEPQSAQQATDGGKDTKNQSRTDPSSEPSGFTGSTEDIANKVRSILNSPDGGNIDTFGQTLIRHGDKDLATRPTCSTRSAGRRRNPLSAHWPTNGMPRRCRRPPDTGSTISNPVCPKRNMPWTGFPTPRRTTARAWPRPRNRRERWSTPDPTTTTSSPPHSRPSPNRSAHAPPT